MEPTAYGVVSYMLLQQVGSPGNSYKREIREGLHNMVSETCSPPRTNAELRQRPRRHLLPGFSFDLTANDPSDGQPWDFRIESKRRRAREMIRQHKPFVLVGSPECTAFSSWQHLNEKLATADQLKQLLKRKAEAKLHLNFVVSLYIEQIILLSL